MPGNYTSAPFDTCRMPCANERTVVWNSKSSRRLPPRLQREYVIHLEQPEVTLH